VAVQAAALNLASQCWRLRRQHRHGRCCGLARCRIRRAARVLAWGGNTDDAHGSQTDQAGGVDPATGEVLADDSPLSSPHVIRALFIAAKALELMAAAKPARPAAAAPGNAGKPWAEDEDQRLLAAFDAGTPVAELARTHERSSGAINSRLIRLGRLQVSRDDPPA
jgi:hypothetical protein